MIFFGMILKLPLTIAALIYLRPDSLGSAAATFAIVYGLATWLIFYVLKHCIMAFTTDGIIFGLIYVFFVPALTLSVPLWILMAIFPGETGTTIYGAFLAIAGVVCIIRDLINYIRMFKPDSRERDSENSDTRQEG